MLNYIWNVHNFETLPFYKINLMNEQLNYFMVMINANNGNLQLEFVLKHLFVRCNDWSHEHQLNMFYLWNQCLK